jgi:hypothetical protein
MVPPLCTGIQSCWVDLRVPAGFRGWVGAPWTRERESEDQQHEAEEAEHHLF